MNDRFFSRHLLAYLKEAATYYPVISLSGPRQAGKSTLLNKAFSNYTYISLEDPDTIESMKLDPRGFFSTYTDGIIIDEAQKFPELFSYLQGVVDEARDPGRFVLSGSQNYLMKKNISQSLSGRVDLSTLFPLDIAELPDNILTEQSTEEIIVNGFYPGKFVNNIPPKIFYRNYIRTYLERDVSEVINISNITSFRTFLKLLAYNASSILNITHLSNQLNTAVNTVKSWISILESSYIIFMLPAYHRNFGKRLIKSPKLYFYDSGLLCHLLNIHSVADLNQYEKSGAVFENLVIAEKAKYNAHRHIGSGMTYFRDSNGIEVDLIESTTLEDVSMYEITSGMTYKTEFLKPMSKLKAVDEKLKMNLIYKGDRNMTLNGVNIFNWKQIHTYGKNIG